MRTPEQERLHAARVNLDHLQRVAVAAAEAARVASRDLARAEAEYATAALAALAAKRADSEWGPR